MSSMREYEGHIDLSFRVEVPQGCKPQLCEHPAVEAVIEALPQAVDVWIEGVERPCCHVFFEIHEEDVKTETGEEEE